MGLWTDNDKQDAAGYEWLHQPVRPAAPPPRAPEPPPPPPRRRRGRIVAAVAAGVVALTLLSTLLVLELTGNDSGTENAVAPLPVSGGKTGETRINQIYERVEDSVVSIQVSSGGGGAGSGSGFIVNGNGTVVTNDHVVEDANEVQVVFDDNGRGVAAEVIGTDPSSDLAVLKVDPDDAPELKPLTIADSDNVRVGDNVIAVGFPLGLDRTATAGIISGLGRTIQAPNNFSIDNVLQTDAPINPGNSGGPLLDDRGRVIGVNSQIATAGSNGSVGIGFAVPSNTVRDVVPRLERGQTIRRAYLGVSTSQPANGAGAALAQVNPNGPADDAGLRAGNPVTGQGGDVITSVNGKSIGSPDDLTSVIGALEPGDRAKVGFLRSGQRREVTVTLDERPATVSSP